MTWRCSAAQFSSMLILCIAKHCLASAFLQGEKGGLSTTSPARSSSSRTDCGNEAGGAERRIRGRLTVGAELTVDFGDFGSIAEDHGDVLGIGEGWDGLGEGALGSGRNLDPLDRKSVV